MLNFSEADILRGKVVSPDWYRIHIDNYEEKLSKNGDSQNMIYDGTIIRNASTGGTEFAGVPIRWQFNTKAKGLIVGFLGVFDITPEFGKNYNLEAFTGKEIDIFVENEIYDGRIINKVNNKYRKPQA